MASSVIGETCYHLYKFLFMIWMVVQYPISPIYLLIEDHGCHSRVHGKVGEVDDRHFSFFIFFCKGEVCGRYKEAFSALTGHFPSPDSLAESLRGYRIRSGQNKGRRRRRLQTLPEVSPFFLFFYKTAGYFAITAQPFFVFFDSFFIKGGRV